MPAWSAMILAGGRGRRLGGCVKPLLPIGGMTILARQRAMLARLGAVPILIAPPDAAGALPSDVTIVHDEVDAGALGGLYTALRSAPGNPVVVLAGDLPFVTAATIEGLLGRLGSHDAAIPCDAEGWHPLCAVYDRRAAASLRACIDQGIWRVSRALDALDVTAVRPEELATMGVDPMELLNVNTSEDVARAEIHAATLAAPTS